MFFCPICKNSFNISKTIAQTGGATIEEIVLSIVNGLELDPDSLQKLNIDEIKTKDFF